jgi:hypothetical protein
VLRAKPFELSVFRHLPFIINTYIIVSATNTKFIVIQRIHMNAVQWNLPFTIFYIKKPETNIQLKFFMKTSSTAICNTVTVAGNPVRHQVQ